MNKLKTNKFAFFFFLFYISIVLINFLLDKLHQLKSYKKEYTHDYK